MTTKNSSTMSKKEYREALVKVGATQESFADFVPFGRRSSQGYALGEQPVPPAIARLLRLMIKHGVTIETFDRHVR